MLRRLWLIGVLTLSLTAVLPAAAQTPTPVPIPITDQTDPASLIGSYYNAITLRDYTRAYSYWEAAPANQTEAQFAAGFSDTASVQALVQLPIFEDAGAGNVHASVPTFLIANRTDGTQAYYAGCFTTHKTNVPVGDAAEPDPNWYLQKGELRQQDTVNLNVLTTACAQPVSLTDDVVSPSLFTPIQAVQTYFIEIANGNMNPVSQTGVDNTGNIFAQTFASQLTGAEDLQVFVNPELFTEGAAGSIYANIPVLVTFTTVDLIPYTLSTCFVARKSNVPVGDAAEPDPDWHISSSSGTSQPDLLSAITVVGQGCMP